MFNCIYVKLMTGTYRLDKVGSCCFSLSQVVVRLVGTKKACGQGGCGACTVMVSRIDRQQHKIQYPSLYFHLFSCFFILYTLWTVDAFTNV